MPGIDIIRPLYVGVVTGQQAQITNNGNSGIYYQDASKGGTISATINDGTISPTSTLIYNAPLYLLGVAAGAQAQIIVGPAVSPNTPEKQLIQLAIIAELLAEGLNVKGGSLDFPQDTSGL